MKMIDSHIHLQDFGPDVDISAIVEQADALGVSYLVCNGTSEADWSVILDLADQHRQVVPCLGLHPWFVVGRSAEWESKLEEMISTTNCGVGEIGLDRSIADYDEDAQEYAFRVQLDIARRYSRPATLHCVRAWGLLLDVLKSEPALPDNLLIHAYGGSVDLVKPLAAMGVYFSFSGKVLDRKYERAREAIWAVPPDRLLIESDAPNMLPPERFRTHKVTTPDGKDLNHPANLPLVVAGIADLLGESRHALIERTWRNARVFFGSVLGRS
ncbi:MAG: TatD family hydrolase [Armatimonadota bacterium]|nr:TatD family hydrolase [bacterium]